MDPRRGMNERVSCHLASRGFPASALMHGGGYGVLSLCVTPNRTPATPCHASVSGNSGSQCTGTATKNKKGDKMARRRTAVRCSVVLCISSVYLPAFVQGKGSGGSTGVGGFSRPATGSGNSVTGKTSGNSWSGSGVSRTASGSGLVYSNGRPTSNRPRMNRGSQRGPRHLTSRTRVLVARATTPRARSDNTEQIPRGMHRRFRLVLRPVHKQLPEIQQHCSD